MAENPQSTQAISKIFGVSTRRIEQLTTDGVIQAIPNSRPRKYDLMPTIQRYIKFLSDKANGREKKDLDAANESARIKADAEIKSIKAEMARLELAEMKGTLHRAEDVEAIMTDHVLMLRGMMMALPGKLAVDCANAKTAPQAAEIIKKEVYRMLDRLANYQYDPEEYKKRVRERQGWNEQHGETGDE